MKKLPKYSVGIMVFGACGRMGRAVTRLASESPDFHVAALIEKSGHPAIGSSITIPRGTSATETTLLDHIPDSIGARDIVIDFSEKNGFKPLMKQLSGCGLRLVSGTTGLSESDIGALRRYARKTAVLYDTNMSFGISVLKRLFKEAHACLGDDFDAELIECHHRHKKDYPSGTALSLAREVVGDDKIAIGRGRKRTRERGTLHLHSIRTGGIPGDHEILFSSDEETVTLSHRALSRDVFARGALRAALFIAGKSDGLFSMKHVLENSHE